MTARNIEIVLGGLVDAVRYRDPERIAGFLAPDLVGDGVSPGLRCVFTFSDGKVIRWRDFRTRAAAMAAAGASTTNWR
jgi:hypothetical protein